MKKRYLILSFCGLMGAGTLAGCGPQHTHNFVMGHDEAHHFEVCECGEKQNIADHVFTTTTTPATCEHGVLVTHTCECGYSYVEDDHNMHNYEQKHDTSNHWLECKDCHDKKEVAAHNVEVISTVVSNGVVIDTYKCKDCDYQYKKDSTQTVDHNFVASIKKVATCQEPGIKVYKCSDCSYSFEEEYDDFDAHKWDNGTLKDGVTTYHCENEGCIETKDVISHKESVSASVKKEDLAKAGTLELKEAAINFDNDSLEGLSEDVTIAAEKVESESISTNLTSETKELIKDAPIFDFSMKDGEEEVHNFLGKVTVSVPYTLRDGEDPDNIAVVYISEDGATENIAAKYSNGFVSFETSHFSYYAVVEMTREEACELLGHNYFVYRNIPSTCSNQGFIQSICKRCGDSHIEFLPLQEHNYKLANTVISTTTTHGYNEYRCSQCGDTYRTELPLAPESTSSDSFFLNFVKSVLADQIDAKFALINADDRSEQETGEAIMYLSGENPFLVSKSNGKVSYVYSGAKGYSARSYIPRDDQTVPNLMRVKDALNRLPNSLGDLINRVEQALYKVCVTKKVENGLAFLRFDRDVAHSFIEKVKTLNLQQLFDYLLGDGTYSDIMSFIESSFARTVAETLDELKKHGIDSKDMFEVVKALPLNIKKSYDEIFTDEVLASKGSEFLEDVIGKAMSFTDFQNMVDSYKDLTVYQLIDQITERENMAEEYIFPIIEKNIDNIEFELILTEQGQLISGSGSIEAYTIEGSGYNEISVKPSIPDDPPYDEPEELPLTDPRQHIDKDNDGYCDLCGLAIRSRISRAASTKDESKFTKVGEVKLSLSTAINVEESKAIVNQLVSKSNKFIADNKFTITDGPIIPLLEKYYGVHFTLQDSISSSVYTLVSESTTKFSDDMKNFFRYADANADANAPISGKLIIYIDKPYRADETFDWASSYLTLSNSSICKRIGNNENLFISYSYGLRISNVLFQPDGSENRIYVRNNLTSNFRITYNLETGEFDLINEELLTHEYKATKISYNEYKKNFYTVGNSEYYDFYKIECKHCNFVSYEVTAKGEKPYLVSNNKNFLSGYDLDEEAKKYNFYLYTNYNGPKDSYRICVSPIYGIAGLQDVVEIGRNKSPSYQYDPHIKNFYKNTSFTYGNVTIEITYTNPEHPCIYNENIVVKVNNKVVRTFKNIIHDTDKSGYHYEVIERYTHGCVSYETEQKICDGCGQVLNTYTYTTSEHHNYVETGRIESTATLDGIIEKTCTECGDTDNDYLYHHTHHIEYDYENERYHCEECDKTWDEYPEHEYVVEDVTEQYLAYLDEYESYQQHSRDVKAYSLADLCGNGLYFNNYELILGGYKDGELDLNYVSSLDTTRIYYKNLLYVRPFKWVTNSYVYVIDSSELNEFTSTLPEGYEAGVAVIKFVRTPEQIIDEMRYAIESIADNLLMDKNTITEISEDGATQGYSIHSTVNGLDCQNEAYLVYYLETRYCPIGFSTYGFGGNDKGGQTLILTNRDNTSFIFCDVTLEDVVEGISQFDVSITVALNSYFSVHSVH